MMTFDLDAVFARNRALFGDAQMSVGQGDPAATAAAGEEGNAGEGSETEQLGEAGKRAIERMKAEVKAANAKARDNADAAAKLKAIEDEKRTETEKVAARLAEADAEVAKVPAKVADALKTHLVSLHKINADDAELFLTATDPETLLKQVDRLVEREGEAGAARRKSGGFVATEGKQSTVTPSDERETVRTLFGSG